MNDASRRKYVFAFATQYSSVRLKVRGPGALGLSGVQRFAAYSWVKLPMSPDSVRKYCTASNAAWKNTLRSKLFTWAASLRPPVKVGSPFLLIRIIDRKSTRLNSSHSQISYAV